jgi:hypothetical protein
MYLLTKKRDENKVDLKIDAGYFSSWSAIQRVVFESGPGVHQVGDQGRYQLTLHKLHDGTTTTASKMSEYLRGKRYRKPKQTFRAYSRQTTGVDVRLRGKTKLRQQKPRRGSE